MHSNSPAAYKSYLLNCAIFENKTNFLSSAELEDNFFVFVVGGGGGDESRRGRNVGLKLIK